MHVYFENDDAITCTKLVFDDIISDTGLVIDAAITCTKLVIDDILSNPGFLSYTAFSDIEIVIDTANFDRTQIDEAVSDTEFIIVV